MTDPTALYLYEEIMLLALRNKEGTVATGFSEYAVAGAVLAELLLDRRISVEDKRNQLVDLQDVGPTGDPIIDDEPPPGRLHRKYSRLASTTEAGLLIS